MVPRGGTNGIHVSTEDDGVDGKRVKKRGGGLGLSTKTRFAILIELDKSAPDSQRLSRCR